MVRIQRKDGCGILFCMPGVSSKSFGEDLHPYWIPGLEEGNRKVQGTDETRPVSKPRERYEELGGLCAVAKSFVSISSDQKKRLFAVFKVRRFLCANGLPFRGTDESSIEGDGLYLRFKI